MKQPQTVIKEQWQGYPNPVWDKKDKDKVIVLYSFVERRKSLFLRAYFKRHGYRCLDLGDHIKEDVRWGKEYGNRMECNPMYFTSGALIRNLMKIHKETGLSKEEIVDKYVFLGGGGQCGPCRYGMYPQEYLKVVNEAGFKGFRILIFGSDIIGPPPPENSAFKIDLLFRIDMLMAIILADLLHVTECALRPRVTEQKELFEALKEGEEALLEACSSPLFLTKIPITLSRLRRKFQALRRKDLKLPLLFVTGEFFANLAHNEGNYNLRRFIMDEGCDVIPGLFTQRVLYDNWRRLQEASRGLRYAVDFRERAHWIRSMLKQQASSGTVKLFYYLFKWMFDPSSFGGRADLMDLDHLAELARDYYHPEIFGGEGNLEIAEAIHYAGKCDGFISCKPFGCMASSGVSDGVQAKIMAMYPELDFLSIETSGDNEVSILGRVSMLLFKAKQKLNQQRSKKAHFSIAGMLALDRRSSAGTPMPRQRYHESEKYSVEKESF